MVSLSIFTGLFFVLILATVFIVLQKIQTGNSAAEDDVRQEFSFERYRPMFRLLDESDFRFIDSGVLGPVPNCDIFGPSEDRCFGSICVIWEPIIRGL